MLFRRSKRKRDTLKVGNCEELGQELEKLN